MKGQTATNWGRTGYRNTWCRRSGRAFIPFAKRFVPTAESTMEESRRNVLAGYRPFSRRVGLRYSIQVLYSTACRCCWSMYSR